MKARAPDHDASPRHRVSASGQSLPGMSRLARIASACPRHRKQIRGRAGAVGRGDGRYTAAIPPGHRQTSRRRAPATKRCATRGASATGRGSRPLQGKRRNVPLDRDLVGAARVPSAAKGTRSLVRRATRGGRAILQRSARHIDPRVRGVCRALPEPAELHPGRHVPSRRALFRAQRHELPEALRRCAGSTRSRRFDRRRRPANVA